MNSIFNTDPKIIRTEDGEYAFDLQDNHPPILCSKISSWIKKVDSEITKLEEVRRAKVDSNYIKETLKQRKKRVSSDDEWEFIKLHPIYGHVGKLNCINQIIADCEGENNLNNVKGVYRLKGTNIILCDLCNKDRQDADIKLEIENQWNDTKSRLGDNSGATDSSPEGSGETNEEDLSDNNSDSDDEESGEDVDTDEDEDVYTDEDEDVDTDEDE